MFCIAEKMSPHYSDKKWAKSKVFQKIIFKLFNTFYISLTYIQISGGFDTLFSEHLFFALTYIQFWGCFSSTFKPFKQKVHKLFAINPSHYPIAQKKGK